MLDEIDKLGMDFRGDPVRRCSKCSIRSRTHAFSDHYLEVPFDLEGDVHHHGQLLDPIPPSRCATGWRSSSFPATWTKRSWRSRRQFLTACQLEAHGLNAEQVAIEHGRDACHRSANTRIRPACATSSGPSPTSAARLPSRGRGPTRAAADHAGMLDKLVRAAAIQRVAGRRS